MSFSLCVDDDMARMVQCGFAPIAFFEVIGVIVGNDVAHSKGRAYFFFNENKPLASAFEHELLARFELAHCCWDHSFSLAASIASANA